MYDFRCDTGAKGDFAPEPAEARVTRERGSWMKWARTQKVLEVWLPSGLDVPVPSSAASSIAGAAAAMSRSQNNEILYVYSLPDVACRRRAGARGRLLAFSQEKG